MSAVVSPALLGVLLGPLVPDGELQIDYLAIVQTLVVSQMLPLALGLAVHHWAPALTARIVKPLSLLANLLLLAVVALLLVREFEMLTTIFLRGWLRMLLLLGISLGIGWCCGGPGQAGRISLSLTTGVRNAAVGLVIVSNNFPDTPAVTAVVAYSLVSIFGSLACAGLFRVAAGRSVHPHCGFPSP